MEGKFDGAIHAVHHPLEIVPESLSTAQIRQVGRIFLRYTMDHEWGIFVIHNRYLISADETSPASPNDDPRRPNLLQLVDPDTTFRSLQSQPRPLPSNDSTKQQSSSLYPSDIIAARPDQEMGWEFLADLSRYLKYAASDTTIILARIVDLEDVQVWWEHVHCGGDEDGSFALYEMSVAGGMEDLQMSAWKFVRCGDDIGRLFVIVGFEGPVQGWMAAHNTRAQLQLMERR